MKGLALRLIILVLVVGVVVALFPQSFAKVPYGGKVVTWRNQVLASQPQLNNLVQSAQQIDWQALWATAKEQKLPQNPFSGEKREIKVEELVSNLTEELKQLPQEKAKEVKTDFCADVVAEAQKQGEVAGAKTENQ